MEHFSSHPRKRFTARVFVHLDASLHNHSHPPTIMRVQITFSFDSRKCSRQTFLRTRQWLQMRILQQLANDDRIIKRQFDICGMWWHYHLPGFCKTQSQFSIQTLPGIVTRQRSEEELWDETRGLSVLTPQSRSASRRQSGSPAWPGRWHGAGSIAPNPGWRL